jgi:hypothetical protein
MNHCDLLRAVQRAFPLSNFVQAINITVFLRSSMTAIVCAYHAVNNSTVFYVLFQGSDLCYWHTSYIVLLGEDQHVVCHLLRLKSKYLRCLPQAIVIACKLIIVSEIRERFLYSGGRSLLNIKKHEFCAEWHILLCRVSATHFGTQFDPLYVMDFVTCGSWHFCCRRIPLIAFSENYVASSTFLLF